MKIVSYEYLPQQNHNNHIIVEVEYDYPKEQSSHIIDIQEELKPFKLSIKKQELNKGNLTFIPPRWSRDAKWDYLIKTQKYFFEISKDQDPKPIITAIEKLFKLQLQKS